MLLIDIHFAEQSDELFLTVIFEQRLQVTEQNDAVVPVIAQFRFEGKQNELTLTYEGG